MKTILAGTDFTPSSVNACRYAALLAQKLNCKLVIFNMYQTPVYHSNMGLMGLSFPALKRESKQGIETVISQLSEDFPALRMIAFASPGVLKGELESFINKHRVAAVVMGLEAKDKLSKFIYGTKGVSIGGKLKAPVIIVPEQYRDHHAETLLLAVDNLKKLATGPLGQVAKFVKDGQLYLKVLHVRTPEEIIGQTIAKALKIGTVRQEIEMQKASTIEKGIKKYCNGNEIDMIVIVSRKHSVFYNLFNESVTKSMAFASKIPVMAIHE